jgi:hypothetical protein
LAFYRLPSAPRFVCSLRALLAFSGVLLASTAARPGTVHAQTVAGLGDDAIPLPKGSKRFLISGLWNDWDAVYAPSASGGSNRRPLLGALATSKAGVGTFPQLASAEAGVRTLTGQSSFALSLGALDATGEVRQSIAPLGVSLGLTRRLSLRLLVPYVESRDVSQLLLNRVGSTANVGMNPAYVAATGATARATNGAVLSQLDLARTRLAAEIAVGGASAAQPLDRFLKRDLLADSALLERHQAVFLLPHFILHLERGGWLSELGDLGCT